MYPKTEFLETPRLTTAYHRAGTPGQPKLLLLHGNCSSSLFYLPLMEWLSDRFELVAPDLRCFGESEAKPIDATRGLRDFSDDLDAFVEALGWDRFSLAGWSMGGGVAMQYALDHGDKLKTIILIAPLSPYGFGGTWDDDGKRMKPDGLASGAGCVNQQLVDALRAGDRAFAASTIDGLYVLPDFKIPADRKELFIDAVLSTKVGEGMYPGDMVLVQEWPYVCAGTVGVNNTMAPCWCDLSGLPDIPRKVPVLWVHGDSDLIVSDNSMCDVPYLGKLGLVPDYPGEEAFPPQPMLRQTRHVLEQYQARGGSCREVVLHAGHGPFLDDEDGFVSALLRFLEES